MKLRIFVLACIALITGAASAKAQQEVKIGVLYPLSGPTAQIGVDTAALYPNLSIAASWTQSAIDPSTLFEGTSAGWSVGPSLTAPLFHGAVLTAIDAARFDLTYGTEDHLLPALAARGLAPPLALLNLCIQIVDEATQAWRRRRVVEVARAFSVVIDTDVEMPELETGASATFRHESSMPATLARMRSCRAVVSVSNLSDLMHNRTLNGLNAGCVNVVEDNVVHRRVFKHGVNALLFRYDDDSLRDCLELVWNDRKQAYRIAAEGFALRDCRPFRFGGFERILSLAHGREQAVRQPDAFGDELFHVKQSGASAPAGAAWPTNAQRPLAL
jgi:hypothetical protein